VGEFRFRVNDKFSYFIDFDGELLARDTCPMLLLSSWQRTHWVLGFASLSYVLLCVHAVTIEGTDISTSNHVNLQDQMYHYLTGNAQTYQA
jgi:hypothetical protein